MSNRFDGFSQDDIRKLQANPKKTTGCPSSATNIRPAFRGHREGIRRMPEKMQIAKQQQQKQQSKILNGGASAALAAPQQFNNEAKNDTGSIQANDTMEDVNLDRSMSKSLEEALFFQPIRKPTQTETLNEQKPKQPINDSSILQLSNETDSSDSCIIFNDSTRPTTAKAQKLDDDIGNHQNTYNLDSPFKGISLKDFETHRKMIQEQNKQKKELLHKAIEQYSQKTAAETRKIEEIKTELSKLDNDLALDVAILRKQIDMACFHFTNMEKQYMKIETQFLKAKMDLHNAAEKKELLTEHLCTVIAHNEDRKAQKLSELMQKVGLTSADDFEEPSSPQIADK